MSATAPSPTGHARVQRVTGLRRDGTGTLQVEGAYLDESGESFRLGGLYLALDPAPPEGALYILYRIESADTQRVVAVCRAAEGLPPLTATLEEELRRGWLRPGPLARYRQEELQAELERRKGERPATGAEPVALRRAPYRALQGELYRRLYHQRIDVVLEDAVEPGRPADEAETRI